jgi:hypothetical protein
MAETDACVAASIPAIRPPTLLVAFAVCAAD